VVQTEINKLIAFLPLPLQSEVLSPEEKTEAD